jgi:hypothetical protein
MIAAGALVLTAGLALAPYAGSSSELVRLRHALLVVGAADAALPAFAWTPQNVPAEATRMAACWTRIISGG